MTRRPDAPAAAALGGAPGGPDDGPPGVLDVFGVRPFLLLWLSQAATQIGGNMVIYGLTVIILEATSSKTAVSLLFLTFLVPAVLFSALAGVYVDRLDRRLILVVTNVLRAAAFILTLLAGGNLVVILLLNMFVSTVTVFFGPAEASMIPTLVPRHLLISANGMFTLTLNAAFPIGFALVGPLVVTIAGAPALLGLVSALYLLAAVFCWTLPPAPPTESVGLDARQAVADLGDAIGSTVGQLQEGIGFIREHPSIRWSLGYLGIAASLVGVLAVLGTDFATTALGLAPKDFVVIVLPLGLGIVTGILVLNQFGRVLPRRRVIEGGLVALGVLLVLLSIAGPITRFLQRAEESAPFVDLSAVTSLLAVVILIAYLAGMAYGFVMIPSQTQLHEDLPVDVRGRVFGILNMLVSVASFLPILVVGPVSDLIGTTSVILLVALGVGASGVASIVTRGPLRPDEARASSAPGVPAPGDPMGVALAAELTPEGLPRHPEQRPTAVPHVPLPRPGRADESPGVAEILEPAPRARAPETRNPTRNPTPSPTRTVPPTRTRPTPASSRTSRWTRTSRTRATEADVAGPADARGRGSAIPARAPARVIVGRIATLGDGRGPGWVEAIALAGGRVVAAGSVAQARAAVRDGTVVERLGRDEVVVPGLTDAHLHLADAALATGRVDLSSAPTLAAGLAAIRAARESLRDPGAWLEGAGWDADRWGGWPTSRDLARAAPGRRVALWAHDHHALWASPPALAEAGVGERARIRPAGRSVADQAARPTASCTRPRPGSSRGACPSRTSTRSWPPCGASSRSSSRSASSRCTTRE